MAQQITTLKECFGIAEVVFVGDRGMVKASGKVSLSGAGFKVITASTDPRAGLRATIAWATTHKLISFVSLALEDRAITLDIDQEGKTDAALLDGCYVIVLLKHSTSDSLQLARNQRLPLQPACASF